MDIDKKVILITGGTKRVGKSIAIMLAQSGARVIVTYRKSKTASLALAKLFHQKGLDLSVMHADVTRAVSIKRLMDRIRKNYGKLDVLVNNAANFERVSFEKLTEKAWDDSIDTNLKGPFLCALYASRLMRKNKCAKIINIADWAGVRPYKNYLPYCVSKAGVIGLTKALAKELAPNVQVNAIAPGPVLPPPNMSQSIKQRYAKKVPLERWGSPQDIANTIRFLIEGTDFMTGSVIFVDGGQLIA